MQFAPFHAGTHLCPPKRYRELYRFESVQGLPSRAVRATRGMAEPFIYDSHYQVDKPLAFLDLTIQTALPASSSSDDALARRLTTAAKKYPIWFDGQLSAWKANDDQMR